MAIPAELDAAAGPERARSILGARGSPVVPAAPIPPLGEQHWLPVVTETHG